MLGDQGAHVIHVDPPGGPRWKHPADAFYNRSKQRIVLDLKRSDDLAVARGLVASADVVIENFRPGVMERLGVGPSSTADLPALIYCSIPGFAADDPRAHVAAWEGVVGAATDTYARLDQVITPRDDDDPARPVFTALPLASNFAAFHAATAIVMALIARERDGRGQRIEVPMFDAMFELVGANGISVDGVYRVGRSRDTRTYVCADGRRIYCNATSTPRFQRWLQQATGAERPTPELFLTAPAAEWERRINTAGAPTCMVRTAGEWLDNAHARARGTVVELEDPELGATCMAGPQFHLSDSPSAIQGPRHAPDQDRAEILAALEHKPALRDTGTPIGSALEGMRILDFTQVVAGPCAGRILVEYGAEVVKINNPSPESLTTAVSLSGRPTDPGNQQHEHLNRGKRTMLLDLHSPTDRPALDALIDSADVLMQNFALGMAERYGMDFPTVQRRRPDLVYFSLSAYGYGGEMGGYRGFEPNAQAVTGLMDRFGGDGPPLAQPYLLDDYGTGVRGAFAVGLGIFHRLRSGRGQHIDISLVETATYHQAAYLVRSRERLPDAARGIAALGSSPTHRLYRGADDWFFVGTDDAERLRQVVGISATDEPLEHALETAFAERPRAEWVDILRTADIGAHATQHIEDLMQDPWVRAHGLSLTQTLEGVGEMTMPGAAPRLSRTPLQIGKPVRPVGADGPAILAELGISRKREES
jgi:crotonobetainyl-CoA:carnitine CoA-transferase CaiB-like acyl-CoA transferase